MLNAVIRSALNHRMAVLAASLALAVYGAVQVTRLPIDVFPDLDRPRVTIIADAPGMAPEDIEALVTIPLETALHGAPGAVEIRSSSGVGLSAVYVEFDWGSDPYLNRQIVAERLSMLADRLPPGVVPQLAPLSSIMGQIQVVALISRDDRTSPMELRTLADWTVRPRLASVSGIAQVIVMGGERRQLQALVNPNSLVRYGVTLAEVETALAESNQDASGGYLEQSGANEYLVRSLGRIRSLSELADVVVASRGGQAITLSQIARLVEGPPPQRGDGSAWTRDAIGAWQGGPAVVLTIHKQPGADTRAVTRQVRQVLAELQGSLPADVQVLPELYQQSDFIDLAVDNVLEALRDGVLLVAIVLALFLMNVRTTLITLTAIPLSILATAVVFAWWGLSINTMTLGGLAVAVGELVDDAIVDVENIFRRLRQNQQRAQPWNPLRVVYEASVEIRSSIVFSTLLVVLAFAPLMALSGLEGQLFRPLALAYITSLVASLAVSLTVTPVLSYRLLVHAPIVAHDADSSLLRMLKGVAERVIRFSLRQPRLVLGATASAAAASVALLTQLDRDFLPAFNEGAVQVNVVLPPGTSLAQSKQVATQVEHQLAGVPDVISLVRRTGRAELDEHAEGVNSSELIARIDPDSPRSRTEIVDELSAAATSVPGAPISVEQPLAHLISHMLSGVKAQVAVKVFGEDLDVLRREARRVRDAIADVPGVRDLHVEPQIAVPQLRIEADGAKLKTFGLRRLAVNDFVAAAMQGRTVSQVLDGRRTFDLVVRLDDPFRENLEAVRRLVLESPSGPVKLEDVARIYAATGPHTINRDQLSRRVVVQCNVSGRGLVDVVEDIRRRLEPIEAALPPGYFLRYGGQFESQQSAARTMGLLAGASLAGMFLALYALFQSANLALQVLAAIPMAIIGGVLALAVTGQTLTVAAMVGFIALAGIASRNGILLLSHYLHLVEHENQPWTVETIVRGGLERLAPVLMTALTAGIALAPLTLRADAPGKEILYPVATVIVGGLISSTLLDFFVHPALFWTMGLKSAKRVVAERREAASLDREVLAG